MVAHINIAGGDVANHLSSHVAYYILKMHNRLNEPISLCTVTCAYGN